MRKILFSSQCASCILSLFGKTLADYEPKPLPVLDMKKLIAAIPMPPDKIYYEDWKKPTWRDNQPWYARFDKGRHKIRRKRN